MNELTSLGLYFPNRGILDEARSAYIADLDSVPSPADSLARWIDQAILTWARLDVDTRAVLRGALPRRRGGGAAASRAFAIQRTTLRACDEAILADRQAGMSNQGRNPFVIDAIRAATGKARERNQGVLPPAPARLPNRPIRGCDHDERS